eukprot:sb/3465170/
MSRWVSRWLDNIRYRPVQCDQRPTQWREWMESNTGSKWPGFLAWRSFLVFVLMSTISGISFISSTHLVFTPESVTKWRCAVEEHTGITALCKHFERNRDRRSGLCSMDLGSDFEWNYTFTSSPILEYNSYCPLQRTVEPTMVNYLGLVVGSLIGGIFIDTLGRKNVTLICAFFSFLTAMSYYISSNMIMYTYQEFIKGIFNSAACMAVLIWAVEMSTLPCCSAVAALYLTCSTLGTMVTVGVTYLTQQWRFAALILAVAGGVISAGLFIVPESVRYLVAKGKVKSLGVDCGVKLVHGAVRRPRAKDCLIKPQTNRLYAVNAVFLLTLGFVQRLLLVLITDQNYTSTIFERTMVIQTTILVGSLIAVCLTFLPMLFYVVNVFCVLVAGVLLMVSSTTSPVDFLDNQPWTLTR